MPRTLKELHERVLELERENRNKSVAIWQLEEEKLELGKKIEELLGEQDQLLGKQDQEQLLGKQDQRSADLKIKRVTFSDEALCKEVELGDDSLFDGGADDAIKDATLEEVEEETVDIPGGSIEQKAFSRHFYVSGIEKFSSTRIAECFR